MLKKGKVMKNLIDCFVRIQREGICPAEITFVCMLNAYYHSGNSDDAQIFYDKMCQIYLSYHSNDGAAYMHGGRLWIYMMLS